jgi:hypothetical protein
MKLDVNFSPVFSAALRQFEDCRNIKPMASRMISRKQAINNTGGGVIIDRDH